MNKKIWRSLLGLVAAAFCVSCSTPVITKQAMTKIIAVDPDGNPVLYPYRDKNRIVKPEEYTYELQLDRLIADIRASGRKKIMIYVFGGMNFVDDSVVYSEELEKVIWEKSDYYPIFINWESSLLEAYMDHLFYIRRGVRSYSFGPPLFPFFLTNDLCRSVTRLPINLAFQSYGVFYSDYENQQPDIELMGKAQQMKMKWYVGKDNMPLGEQALASSIYCVGFPARILTTPLLDVGGKNGWDVMRHRVRNAFERSAPYEIGDGDDLKMALSPPDGALSLFMNRLQSLQHHNPGYEITLIGHSMGPLILNEMVSRYGDMSFKNVVYLASATSVRETAMVMRPYLERHPESTFYNLCLHPSIDTNDMMNYCVVPRGSVLEWIDLYFSDPVSRDDHTVGQWNKAMECLPRRMGPVQSQVVNKAFGVRDPITNTRMLNLPEQHTDFSDPNIRFWEPDFWQIPPGSKNR